MYAPNAIVSAASAPLRAFLHAGDGGTSLVLAIVLETLECVFKLFFTSTAIVINSWNCA